MRACRVAAIILVGACASGNGEAPDASGPILLDGGPPPVDAACEGAQCEQDDAIYVARNGDDSNAGTRAAPMKTIAAAIEKAATSTPAKTVLIKGGQFVEQIAMKPGVSLHGGFDDSWTQSDGVITELAAGSPVVTFDGITVATSLSNLTIKSSDASGGGASSFAVVVTGSMAIELRDVVVLAGNGASGIDGSTGSNGSDGGDGSDGLPGTEHSGSFGCDSHTVPAGGAGGAHACGAAGGAGGAPGVGSENRGYGAGVGAPGWRCGFASGGTSGAPFDAGGRGSDGAAGGAGGWGASGGELGGFAGLLYVPANGANGENGSPGSSAGGGGGGGGGTNNCDSSGSSGGGGGGGGCFGTAGGAGGGGGGSFGIIAVDSNVVVKSSTVTAGYGGAGGRGGSGGLGGEGGTGGDGGPYGGSAEQDDGGMGGAGGHGGRGGNGGHGGGGGGGPSAALVCVGTATITIPQSTIKGGTGGPAGISSGNSGAPGLATPSMGCTFF
ncbi:MAG: hypothetical protein AB7O24_01770 [Kofleriaceae bacterium]